MKLSGHGVTVVVPSYDEAESAPFQLGSPGTYKLTDAPSGDSANVTVESAPSYTSSGSGAKGSPALGPALLIVSVAALAYGLRRK